MDSITRPGLIPRRLLETTLSKLLRQGTLMFCMLLMSLTPMGLSATEADPLNSPRWGDMYKALFPGQPVVFDARVQVIAPAIGENPLNVPVTVDASALGKVDEVLLFADFNPITRIARFYPGLAAPYLGLRIKLQQSTPVRAAAKTPDGVWHLGGTWVTTTGGGCTLPSAASASPEWQSRLNQVSGRMWSQAPDGPLGSRLRLRIVHPMDTGLMAGIPAFHLQTLDFYNEAGQRLMRIEPAEPVSENPLFSLNLPSGSGKVRVAGRDNNGNILEQWITP